MKSVIIIAIALMITITSISAYSENTLPESIQASTHGNEINLNFSDGKVSGTILFEDQVINLDNAKTIERRSGFLIIDRQNDLKILAKQVSTEKYLVLVKINSDDVKTKFRFLTESNANKSQRNLMDEFLQNQKQQQPDIENMSFRELQDYIKQQQIDEILQKQKEIQADNTNYSYAQSILDKFQKASEITGTALVESPEKTIEPKVVEQYIPELLLTSSHDFKTFWKQTFNIDVQAFDGRINSDPKSSDFNGRIDGVDIKVLLSLDGVPFTTLSGVTANHGNWDGEYFMEEKIAAPGEYVVDVIVSYLGETVSKSSTMFVIAATAGGGSGNNAPLANAGPDQNQVGLAEITLDGSGSSDPESDTITYSWIQISGVAQTLSDTTAASPTFTPTETDTFVFQLTVSDGGGKFGTDSVTITVS